MAGQPERLEDLGRIREKLERLFDESEALGAGDMHDEVFMERYKDEDRLDSLRLSLKYLHERLRECEFIAKGREWE